MRDPDILDIDSRDGEIHDNFGEHTGAVFDIHMQNISPFEGILTQFALPHGVEGPDVSNRNLFNALLMEPRQVAWEHQIVILSPGSKRHLPIRLGVCIIRF